MEETTMNQTAVDWLVEIIKEGIDAEDGSISLNWLYDGTIKKANHKFEQHVKDAFNDGVKNEAVGGNTTPEQYYNKNFKSK